MATKSCTTYRSDNWNLPADYRVTECEISVTLEELLDDAAYIIADEGTIPSTITLKDQNDEDIEVEFMYKSKGKWVCDYLTDAEMEDLEENIFLECSHDEIVKHLTKIMHGNYTKKELRADIDV